VSARRSAARPRRGYVLVTEAGTVKVTGTLQSTQYAAVPPLQRSGIDGEREIAASSQERGEGDLGFEPSQGCPEAEVDAVAKCQMPPLGAGDVESVGVGEVRRVSDGRCEGDQYRLLRRDRAPLLHAARTSIRPTEPAPRCMLAPGGRLSTAAD